VALPPETRRSAVSVARNWLVPPKMPLQSLASANVFPAGIPGADRDWFDSRQRPVRVCLARRALLGAGYASASLIAAAQRCVNPELDRHQHVFVGLWRRGSYSTHPFALVVE